MAVPRHPMYASRKSHSVTLVDNRMESGNAFHVIKFPPECAGPFMGFRDYPTVNHADQKSSNALDHCWLVGCLSTPQHILSDTRSHNACWLSRLFMQAR